MKTDLRTITPAFAKQILEEKNTANRPMNRIHVESLAKEMRGGRWKVNGDTICMGEDALIDGQHRLAAVVLSGVTIQSLFVEGVPMDVFDTIDVGKRRSAGDTLSISGEKNACRIAAMLVLIDKYMTGRADKCVSYSNTEIEDLLKKYPDVRNFIHSIKNGSRLMPPAIIDACHYLFSKKDRDLADVCIGKIATGTGLSEGDPWYAFRERLVHNSLSKAKLTRPYLMALFIKCWNYTREGRASVRCLRWRDKGDAAEPFPVIK